MLTISILIWLKVKILSLVKEGILSHRYPKWMEETNQERAEI